jgi:hypothetical protein
VPCLDCRLSYPRTTVQFPLIGIEFAPELARKSAVFKRYDIRITFPPVTVNFLHRVGTIFWVQPSVWPLEVDSMWLKLQHREDDKCPTTVEVKECVERYFSYSCRLSWCGD